jgi:pyruvate formate lyase activating enzyme
VLENLLANHLLDYVALDLKTDPSRYGEIGGPVDSASTLQESFRMIRRAAEMNGLEYEVRTTCVPGLVEEADIRAIGTMMGACQQWFLQQFVPQHAMTDALRALSPHSPETLQSFARVAEDYALKVGLRGL